MSELVQFNQMIIVLREIRDSVRMLKDAFLEAFDIKVSKPETSGESGGGGGGLGGGMMKGLKKTFKGIGKMIGGIFKSVLGPIALLSDFFMAFLEPLELIMEPLADMGTIFSQLLYPILEPMANAMYSIMPYLEKFIAWFSPILTFLFSVMSPIGILLDGGENLKKMLSGIGNALSNAWNNIKSFFSNLGSNILQKIKDGWTLVMTWFGSIGGTILGWIKNGWTAVINWFKSIPQMILDAIKNAMDFGKRIGESISDWWDDLWD